jgi:hypothetical protein
VENGIDCLALIGARARGAEYVMAHDKSNSTVDVPRGKIGRRRLIGIHLIIVAMIGPSLYDMLSGAEHWPFSPYNMYSGLMSRWLLQRIRLYGIDAQGQEFALLDREEIQPFDHCRLEVSMERLCLNPPRMEKAVRDCLKRYESRRSAGPPILAIRVYKEMWRLQPGKTSTMPDERVLLANVPLKQSPQAE